MWEYYYPDCLEYSDDLYHHGTKGMKWGVRRYQNKDGSLTAAGKKHRSLGQVIRDHKTKKKRKAALEKAREAKAAKKKAEEKAKKAEEKRQKALEKGRLSTRKMTDEELKAHKARLQTEKDIKDLVMETRPMRRLMSKMWSDAIVPGITEGGKELIKKTITKHGSDLLGLNEKKTKSALEALEEEAKTWKAKENIAQSKQKIRQVQDWQEKRDEQLAERRQKQAQKEVDDYNAKREKEYQDSRAGEPYRMKGDGTSTKTASANDVSSGKKYIESSKANSTALSTVRNSESTQKAQAWVEDSRTGEILRNTTVKIDEED